MNPDNQQPNYQQVTYPASVSSNDMSQSQPSADDKVPSVWPGAKGLYRYSKNVVRPYWGPILGLSLLSYVVSAVITKVFEALHIDQSLGQIIGSLLSLYLSIGLMYVYRDSVEGRPSGVGKALKQVDVKTYFNLFGNSIIVGLLTVLSLALFIIPFFFVFPRLVLAQYYVAYEKRGPIEAVKLSWNNMKGNVGKLWGIIGLSIAMGLLIITLIGAPVAIYLLFMYSAAPVILYYYITRQQATQAAPTVSAAPAAPTAPVASN